MRSSKSRSRNKNRNNRPQGGNIVNRVFDSSGPEGKVRGTPQQIIDKYNQLARDAQLAGDRVAVESFQQHAEHYTRMLAAAQKEMEARQQQNQQNQQNNNQNNNGQQDQNGQGGGRNQRRDDRNNAQSTAPGQGDQPDVIDTKAPEADTGLVETPEAKSEEPAKQDAPKADAEEAPKPKRTRTRRKAPKTEEAEAPAAEAAPAPTAEPAPEG